MQAILTRDDDGFDSIKWALEDVAHLEDSGEFNCAYMADEFRFEFYRNPNPLYTDTPDLIWEKL